MSLSYLTLGGLKIKGKEFYVHIVLLALFVISLLWSTTFVFKSSASATTYMDNQKEMKLFIDLHVNITQLPNTIKENSSQCTTNTLENGSVSSFEAQNVISSQEAARKDIKTCSQSDTNTGISKLVLNQKDKLSLTSGRIIVYGFLYYLDQNGIKRPARYATVELYDKTWYGERKLATTWTNRYDDGWGRDGYFRFDPIDNVDELGGAGTLDIFIRYRCDTAVVKVCTDPIYQTAYWGETPVVWDVPDGWVSIIGENQYTTPPNIGEIRIIDPEKRGSWGIYDSILNAHGVIEAKVGYNIPKIIVCWPWSWTAFNDIWILKYISIERGYEWDEDAVLHEYGHWVMHCLYEGNVPPVNYGADGVHYWDSHETLETAWVEGWANFFSCVVRNDRYFWSYDLDSQWPDGDDVEGAIACILWDIYDSTNDGRDTLSMGMEEIWYIVRYYITSGHHVFTIHEFWEGFIRNFDCKQQMWAIYYDHGINKDMKPPTNPNSYISSHKAGVWSSDNTIEVTWYGATDDLSGVCGYSIIWDNFPDSIPDSKLDQTSTSCISSPLSTGVWYLHVRTVDNAGNWNFEAFHIGPFYIDVAKPIVSVSHKPSSPTDSDSVTFTISASDDDSWLAYITLYWYNGEWHSKQLLSFCTPSYSTTFDAGRLPPGTIKYYVTAEDCAGNIGRDPPSGYKYLKVSDDDDEGPIWGAYSTTPSGIIYDNSQDTIRLKIYWSDPSGIYDVMFHYRFGSGPWVHVGYSGRDTDANGNGWYWYDIPRSEWIKYVGQTLDWQSSADDNDNDRPNDRKGAISDIFNDVVKIIDDDITPPRGSNPQPPNGQTYTQDYPSSIRIQATWTDGVSKVRFYYRYLLPDGQWKEVQPSGHSGNTYWYDIPRSEWINYIGTDIQWYSIAWDNDNDRPNDQASAQYPYPPYTIHLAIKRHNTQVEIISGCNTIVDRSPSITPHNPLIVTFKVKVKDLETGQYLINTGTVEFYVDGKLIGTDNDANADGIYEITWDPPQNWPTLGTQTWQAKFTGTPFHNPSQKSCTITIYGQLYQKLLSPHGETYKPGDVIKIAVQVTSDNPAEGNIKGCKVIITLIAPNGMRLAPVELQDPDNDGIYTGKITVDWTILPGWWQIEIHAQKPNYHDCTLPPEKAFYIEIPERWGVDISIEPTMPRMELTETATFTIYVHNTGTLQDTYEISLQGLDPTWYTLSATTITIEPDQTKTITLTVTPPCNALAYEDNKIYSFTVTAKSQTHSEISDTAEAQIEVYITWEYIYEDPIRHTILKIDIDCKCFRFITPDKDYGIRQASSMYEGYVTVYYNGEYVELPAVIIRHSDGELRLLVYAGTEVPFCYARAVDYETGNRYMLRVDPTSLE